MKVNEELIAKYITKTTPIQNAPGTWNSLLVEIFADGVKIGDYKRNYASLMDTFHPFTQNGKDYALYSPDYTCTRIMSLPNCKDIGGEKPESNGFCPVEYAVLHDQEMYDGQLECIESTSPTLIDYNQKHGITKAKILPLINGHYGFVAGCTWGDDTSWKIELLDLSEAHKGKVKREYWPGYLIKPGDVKLKDAINFDLWDPDNHRIGIAVEHYFDLDTKSVLDWK